LPISFVEKHDLKPDFDLLDFSEPRVSNRDCFLLAANEQIMSVSLQDSQFAFVFRNHLFALNCLLAHVLVYGLAFLHPCVNFRNMSLIHLLEHLPLQFKIDLLFFLLYFNFGQLLLKLVAQSFEVHKHLYVLLDQLFKLTQISAVVARQVDRCFETFFLPPKAFLFFHRVDLLHSLLLRPSLEFAAFEEFGSEGASNNQLAT
jgi:hypothetical protein